MLSRYNPDTKSIKEKILYAIRHKKINFRRIGYGTRVLIEICTYETEKYMGQTLKGKRSNTDTKPELKKYAVNHRNP